MVAPLRRVAVRTPTHTGDFAAAEWRSTPDPDRLRAQHEAFVAALRDLGAEVTVLPAAEGLVDACFAYDPVFVVGRGAVILQQAKPARAGESELMERELIELGFPIAGRLTGDARADGGDLFWLDRTTLAAGRGYRTNQAAHDQLRAILAEEGAELVSFDLPHDKGPAHVLHLMSVISPVREDLAVVYEPIAPVALLQALVERGIRWIPVDAEEYDKLGTNILAVAPGKVIMFDGAPRTVKALRAEGVEVVVVDASEIALGDGGPTCLTRPLARD
ncbi:dimethylarginine dimethylaminohydrolase family protein [Nonomuraea sediminis]|uniref:dimethylarginine dimethylaminohydrolase family protein n=1 Tax=Nonomuraea sediminis TaxID=2835864 RepID=UPI00202A1BCE|nr:arginine deiminase family protein [Nonomuraea sediminis]